MKYFTYFCDNHITVASNILVHQECECTSPIQCTCTDGDGGVTYLLGDMNLLSLEKEDAYENQNSPYTCEEWEKMAGHDPAGTMGMKPPEVNNRDNIFCFYFAQNRG